MSSLQLLVIAATAAASLSAQAAGTCYHFDGQAADASYPVNGPPVEIGIGRIQVRDLKLDGAVVAPANRFLKVMPAQHIAGGAAPEMYGKNVAVQMLPREGVHQIRLRYAHQPGAEGARAAMVEVNGARHDWTGSLHKLDGQTIAADGHAARFQVRQPDGHGDNGWISGELTLTSQDGIRSFTLGAAELRLDDVCFER